MHTMTLTNGVKIPVVGYGTWQIKEGEAVEDAIKHALDLGYRHIDTAQIYGNEKGIGRALQASGIPRGELFLTTKVWNGSQGYESTKQAFAESLAKLQTDYVDLYLIHWPAVNLYPDHAAVNRETWRAMEEIYLSGKAKAIGVSNFLPHHLDKLLPHVKIQPMVNQIEFHPGNPAPDVLAYCAKRNILVEAYSPMMKGRVFQIPELERIAQKHQKTIPQVVLRWIVDQGVVPLTKSVTPERMQANLDFFDFSLDDEDRQLISTLSSYGRGGTHPDQAKF
jgi:methylglyoxal/glyoxal reductase